MQHTFLQMDEGMEHQEQLYLLEVLVDNIVIDDTKVLGHLLEPYGPLVVKAKFLDFPDLEFDQGKCPVVVEEPTAARKVISGVPESWTIEWAKDQPDFEKYPQYRVTIPVDRQVPSEGEVREEVDNMVHVLVPQSAIVTGEGLRYINAVLKNELDLSILDYIQQQIHSEVQKTTAGVDSKKVSEYKFAAGKSLLFPMTPYKLIEGLRKSPFYLQVTRSGMYANDKPFFALIGQVKLLLGNSFVKAIMVAGSTKILPVSAHIEDQYPISNIFGEENGTISIFLRLSCFGKSMFDPEREQLPTASCQRKPESYTKKQFRPLYSDEFDDNPWSFNKSCNIDDKYTMPVPWRKPWDELPEFPKPPPVLPAFYEPLPPLPSPPPPPKPFDIGEHLPNLPRCSPHQPPPCYRRAGDPPMSYCTKEMEAQLQREEFTKYTQTDSEIHVKSSTGKPLISNNKDESSKKTVVEPGEQTQDHSIKKIDVLCSANRECDGIHFKPKQSIKEGYNKFDGNSTNQETSKEETGTNNDKSKEKNVSSDKKCTCPRIPDMLLPQPIWKPQCRCRCAAIKAKLDEEKKIEETLKEKLQHSTDQRSEEGSEVKDRSERSLKFEEAKDLKQTSSELSILNDKKCEKFTYPKNMDIFFLPGVDSATNIALTSRECGYDLKRYLKRAEEMGEFDQVIKYIDPNPLSGLRPSKLPNEVKKRIDKEVKKLEVKKSGNLDNFENKYPATSKKTHSSQMNKFKKQDSHRDIGKKSLLRKDGGKTEDDKGAKPTAMSKKEQRVKAKIRASNIYEYTAGMYPGVHVGHKYCVRPLRLVPKTMGWLWNISDLGGILKPGRGWRPGAVRRNVNNLLKEWRKTNKGMRELKPDQEMDMLMMSTKSKRIRPITPKSPGSKKDPDTLKLNPTIHLHKKDRFYYVSMYPVKTESQEELGEEPQPIQFKIDRKHPDGKPSDNESCFSSTESSSDSSSYEVEYIAPAAMKQKKRKVEKAHMFSQYDEEDFMPKKAIKKGAKPMEEQVENCKKSEEKDKKGKKAGKKEGAKKNAKKKK